VTDKAVLDRLDPSARGKVLQADLKALGVTDFGKPFPVTFQGYAGWPELFFDRQPMQLARWPNQGFAKIGKVLDAGSKPRENEKPDRPGMFIYEGDRPQRWLKADEVYLNGYWCYKWFEQCIKVAKIDPEKKTITFAAPHVYGIGGPSGGYYFALNLLEELDSPGEYYVDRKSGILYFWPPVPLQDQEIGLSLLDTPMVSIAGASNIMLRGLVFEFSRGAAITMSGGTHNWVTGCIIRNIATDAVYIRGGTDNGVLSCDLYNLGGAGISLDGGDRATLMHCNNFAENNHIHHFGRLFRTHKDALFLSGVGCRASHNLIHDAPHHAIDFSGNEHLIEFNEIHDVCTETDDAGAIYTGRDWTVRGTVIRNNFFHDIGGSLNVGNQAIYVDDTSCGVISIGNVICRVYRGFLIGGGRDNVLDNNIIVDCKIPIHIDNRGMNWCGPGSEDWDTLMNRLKAVPYQQEPWKSRYPELANILDDQPGFPKRNRVTRNLIVGCGKMDVAKEARECGTIENNWETPENPGFLNASNLDFTLKPDSPAFQKIKGFKAIPFDQIGLYNDLYRKGLQACATHISGKLEKEFLHPPDSARPWVYYFVMDGNLTREGITADFEALERAGIGGVIFMEVN
ncbi:MAG: right-handed parallel beta-helix repeat-containing protein, partial [Candidatus Omnitrophica bacterium]|nr:right-handed parallel beta-helix repeat-containing protein [Candidatus Omnitrophota bacterium]